MRQNSCILELMLEERSFYKYLKYMAKRRNQDYCNVGINQVPWGHRGRREMGYVDSEGQVREDLTEE